MEIKDFELFTVKTNYVLWNLDDTHQEDLQHIAIIYKVRLNDEELDKIRTTADGHDSLGSSWYSIASLSVDELSPLASVIKENKFTYFR